MSKPQTTETADPRYWSLTKDQRKAQVRKEYLRLIEGRGDWEDGYATLALETFMLFTWREKGWVVMVAETDEKLEQFLWDREW